MARKAAKRLTPKGVLALKKEGYYADSEAVGLYVQVAYRQKGTHEKGEKKGKPKLDRKHGPQPIMGLQVHLACHQARAVDGLRLL